MRSARVLTVACAAVLVWLLAGALAGCGTIIAPSGAGSTQGTAPAVPSETPPPAGNYVWRGTEEDVDDTYSADAFEIGLHLSPGMTVHGFRDMWSLKNNGQDVAGLATQTAADAATRSGENDGPPVISSAKEFLQYSAVAGCQIGRLPPEALVAVSGDVAWEIASGYTDDTDDQYNEDVCIAKRVSGGWFYLSTGTSADVPAEPSPAAVEQAMKPLVSRYLPVVSSANGIVR